MRLDDNDYTKLVTRAYHRKMVSNELPRLLPRSTTAKLKKECLKVYEERMLKKDEQALRVFFDVMDEERPILPAIKRAEPDRFKTLDKYLKGETESTDFKNVRLLAWLIDFPYRPFTVGMDVILTDEERLVIEKGLNNTGEKEIEPHAERIDPHETSENGSAHTDGEEDIVSEADAEVTEVKKELRTPSFGAAQIKPHPHVLKMAGVVLLSLLVSCGGMYIFRQYGDENAACMYWAGDHYEQVPCNEEVKGRQILGLNEEKMKNLKRIMQVDTISERSVGKVYYIRDSGTIKFYTSGGNYPDDNKRHLMILSRYMFEKHLRKQTPTNDSSNEFTTNK